MNHLINSLLSQLSRPIIFIPLALVIMASLFGLFDSCRSRKYDKERQRYEEESKARAARVSQLEGENTEMRKQIAELEPKALAYTAIVDSKIKVDEALKDKIEKVTEDAANAESTAQNTIPCRVRAQRICDLFRSGDRNFNCDVLFAECSGQ